MQNQTHTYFSLLIVVAFALSLSACSSLRFPGVYRIDIGQGNLITVDMVEKLKLGMSPRQVEFVMGSAMIRDPFHPNRWDYVYSLETGSGAKVENRLTLYFENSRLARIDDERYRHPDAVKNELLDKLGVPKADTNMNAEATETETLEE